MGPKENDNLSQSAKPNWCFRNGLFGNLKNIDVHQHT